MFAAVWLLLGTSAQALRRQGQGALLAREFTDGRLLQCLGPWPLLATLWHRTSQLWAWEYLLCHGCSFLCLWRPALTGTAVLAFSTAA